MVALGANLRKIKRTSNDENAKSDRSPTVTKYLAKHFDSSILITNCQNKKMI